MVDGLTLVLCKTGVAREAMRSQLSGLASASSDDVRHTRGVDLNWVSGEV